MASFEVSYGRCVYERTRLIVEASSIEQAEQLAKEQFDEDSATWEFGGSETQMNGIEQLTEEGQ